MDQTVRTTYRDYACLAILAVVFLAWRAPLMYRQCPGQDEDFYGVPGMTILRTGLPQIPYIPSRDPNSIYYKADVCLYTLPPLGFYVQALVHLILGDGIGPARMASALAGLAAVWLVYKLSMLWFEDSRTALWAALVYVLSRAFYFPATMARPDMLATTLGLAAVWFAARYRRKPSWVLITAGGLAAGLSLLAHPMGVVPCAQVVLWLLLGPVKDAVTLTRSVSEGTDRNAPRSRVGLEWPVALNRSELKRRIAPLAIFAAATLGALCLWTPLIALHPDLFWSQFRGNVLSRSGPGLGHALLQPWSVLAVQGALVWEHLMPIQAGLYALSLAWSIARAWHTNSNREFLFHLLASVLLLVFFMGEHPAKGYYAYPAALASVAVGLLASSIAVGLERLCGTGKRWCQWAVARMVTLVLLLALLPGAGLRTLWAHARNWDNPAYDARQLARIMMDDVPVGSRGAVDGYYAMYFYLAGRDVVDAIVIPFYFDVRSEPFDYVILGPIGLQQVKPFVSGLELIKTYGNRSDPFQHYAELFSVVRQTEVQQE